MWNWINKSILLDTKGSFDERFRLSLLVYGTWIMAAIAFAVALVKWVLFGSFHFWVAIGLVCSVCWVAVGWGVRRRESGEGLHWIPSTSLAFILFFVAFRFDGFLTPSFPIVVCIPLLATLFVNSYFGLWSAFGVSLGLFALWVGHGLGWFDGGQVGIGGAFPLKHSLSFLFRASVYMLLLWFVYFLVFLFEKFREQSEAERLRLERVKEELISNVSHEFRTPLSAISGALRLVNQGVAFSSAQRESLLEVAERNAKRLGTLVEDLLDIRKLEAGGLALSCTWVEPIALVNEAVETQKLSLQKQNIQLELNIPPILPVVWLDPGRLHQVLSNLLSNAIKFSPQGARVLLGAEVEEGVLRFEVEDHGVGIPKDKHPFVFERFVRLHPELRVPGTGLGLAIAKKIVEAHDGRISFQSDSGEGTKFCVELPIRQPSPDELPRASL